MSNDGTSGFQRLKYSNLLRCLSLLWYFCNIFFFKKTPKALWNEEASQSLEISIREHVRRFLGKLELDTEITPVEKETDTDTFTTSRFFSFPLFKEASTELETWKELMVARNNVFMPWHDFCRKCGTLKPVLNFSALLYFVVVLLLSSHCNSLTIALWEVAQGRLRNKSLVSWAISRPRWSAPTAMVKAASVL